MRGKHILILSFFIIAIVAIAGIPTKSQIYEINANGDPDLIAGRNVNMVSGITLPDGDPYLQRQNEPSIAVSTRNPMHLLAGANDYRTVDMPFSEGELPGQIKNQATGDAWLGIFKSLDGGESWTSTLLDGYPQQQNSSSPLHAYQTAADPVVRAGTNGLFFYSGIVFDRLATENNAVFMARFIDNNNDEEGNPIVHVDTTIIDKLNGERFKDKPWIAVDIPKKNAKTTTIAGQSIPKSNVYIVYSVFKGEGASLESKIMFCRSTDCGNSWENPLEISQSHHLNQGATIAVDPRGNGHVYVAWRRFASGAGQSAQSNAIVIARSTNGGKNFPDVIEVADVPGPFDQPTSSAGVPFAGTTFRTNSYPSMTIDKKGRIYIAWAQREVDPTYPNDSRVLIATSKDAFIWTTPMAVESSILSVNGVDCHEFMPSITFAAGRLILAWYDTRKDYCPAISPFYISDTEPIRHTIDVRVAQGTPGDFPVFRPSVQVSKYLWAMWGSPGNYYFSQVQFNPPNYPLFKGGTVPFHGDYIEIAPSSPLIQTSKGNWRFNTEPTDSQQFHLAWTDNRDVRPPQNNNWEVYNPPSSNQSFAQSRFFLSTPCADPKSTGMRNQNIYTSLITSVLEAGMPGNNKPLGTLGTNPATGELIPRAFVIFVKNPTEDIRHYRLQIIDGPDRGTASFLEFDMLEEIDVSIAPFSSISRPLFVTSSDENDTVTVDVFEIDQPGGSPVAGGARSTIVINPDKSSPDVTGDLATTETHDPDIANPNIVNWTYVNPNIVNPNIVNDALNPNIVNPNIVNPNIVNPNIVNPNIVNLDIETPNIVNPNIVNPNIVNPNIVNSSIEDANVTDIEWTVTNAGNTVSSYTFKIFARESLPRGIYAQLLVYKVHYSPATDGIDCNLQQTPHHELLLNIVNPNIVNPNIVNPNIVNPNIVNSAIENATFFLSPGDEANAILRLIDPDPGVTKFLQSGRKFKIQQFAESLDAATGSQAVDSPDAKEGDTTIEADSTDLIIMTAGLTDGTVGEVYPSVAVPYVELEAAGGDGTYVWYVNSELLPPGLGFTNDGIISGIPQEDPLVSYPHIYSFLVQVSSAGDVDTQNLSITINSAEEPTPPLNIESTTLPPGTVGNYYGFTLQATGGTSPRAWSKTSGSLPLGLTLDSAGVISGTIVEDENVNYPHDYAFDVQVTDANEDTDIQPLSITVDEVVYPDLTISGTITDEYGSAVHGVSIYGLPHAPQTDSYGYYTDTVPYGWSGTITPFKAGYTFYVSAQDPSTSRMYDQITEDQYSQDFIADTINYIVSGTVTFYTSPLAGVLMNGLPGTPVTDANGYYSTPVPHGWSGTVTPELLDYIFEPSIRTYSSITSDHVNQNYTATFVGIGQDDPFEENDDFASATDMTAGTYTNIQLHDDDWYRANVVQGSDLKVVVDGEHPNNIDVEILDGAGNRIIGAYGDPEDVTVFASDLPAGWHYIRVIYLGTSGFWNAYDMTITTGNDLGNGDVSGNVSDTTPAPLENVEVTAFDTQSDNYFSTSTDANGDYKLSLPPSMYKLYFDAGVIGPPNYVSEYYDNQLTFENADVIDVQVGMFILDIDAMLELESVLSIVTTSLPAGNLATAYNAQLEAAGGVEPYTWNLTLGSLPDGLVLHSNGVIDGTPTTLGPYEFTVEVTDSTGPLPQTASQALSIVVNTYAGTEYVISGTVTPALAGVVMSGLPGNPETNVLGEYTVIVYSGWSGTVTPILSGYAFDPANRTYSNVESSLTGENYTASVGYTISGQVTLGGSPLEGVLMSGLPGNPYTDVNGLYSMAVPSGWTDTVTPTLPGFSFTPPNISYSNVISHEPGQNYITSFQGGQDDIYENNDDVASAAEVTLGTHMNLVLEDQDWFKVYIPSGNEDKDLRVNIKGHSFPDPSGGKDMDFIVLDESEKMLGYVLSSSDDETLYISDVVEGWYYIGQTYIGQEGTVYSMTLEVSDNFGLGYISGRITDETSGQPLEGIYVELYGQPFDWGNSRPLITTDANGEYKVGYTPGNYSVKINLQVFRTEPYALDLNYIGETYNSSEVLSMSAGITIDGIDAELLPGGTITGRITGPDGIGLSNSLAYVYSSDNNLVSYGWPDANGNYIAERIPTGNYKVRARGGIYGSMWYDEMGSFDDGLPVPVRVGMTTPNIDLQLEESAIIEGQVTDSGQNPIQDVIVRVYDVSGISLWSGRTNEEGYYWVGRRLPTGDVKIFFDASSAQGNYASEYHTDKLLIEDADPIPVQAGQTTYGIDAVLAAGGTISGRVTDSQGNEFPGVNVVCFDADGERYHPTTSDADGNYAIPNLPPDGYYVRFRAGIGNYAMEWYDDKGSSVDGEVILVGAGQTISGIDAQLFDNGGFVSGRVTDIYGNGIAGVYVWIQDMMEKSVYSSVYTNADGYYTAPRIPACNAKVFFNSDSGYLNYMTEYYNDKSTFETADLVGVTFGQETPGINAVLASIPPVNITTTSLPNGEVAGPYEISLEATGGREFYYWSLISGDLPPGLSLNSKGEIIGTPTASGPYNFTVRVTDSSRNQQLIDTQTLSLSITTYQGTGYLISGSVEFDNLTLGGVVLQGLPGNPVTSPNGEYIVAVPQGWSGTVTPTHSGYFFDPTNREYTDVDSSLSGQDYLAYELTLQISTEWLLNGTEGYPYNQTLVVEGGTVPYTWSLAPGSSPLPFGLTLASDGTISGTPTHPANYDFTVRVTDSSSPVPQLVEKALSISIHGDPVTDYPILYWKLDEGDGTIALDSSGHNDNGALNGNVTYTLDSVDGHAAEILANGWIDRTHEGPFHFVSQATIMARVKIDYSQQNRFVWKLQYDEPYRGHPYSFEISLDINGNMLHLDSGNGLIQDIFNCPHYQIEVNLPNNGFVENQYNQIAVTINGDVYKIFINGTEVASATGAPFEVHDSIQHFWVGGAEWSEYWLGGNIDEVMVFNRAYESQDISEIYNMGILPTISGTVRLSDGSPLPWVRMNGLGDIQVQENGTYIGVVSPSWTGTVTPDMGGFYFDPPNRSYDTVTTNITGEDYTAYEWSSLYIQTDSIPNGKKDESYSTTLIAADGVEPYSWNVVSGSLPLGLNLDPLSGIISGTPSEAGDFNFTVRVIDSSLPQRAAEINLSLFVSAAHQGFWNTSYPFGGNMYSRGLALDFSNPDVIFATAGNRGIFRSLDAAANWNNIIEDPSWPYGESDYRIFKIHQASGNYYTCTGGRIYMSSDSGGTWDQIYEKEDWDISTLTIDPTSTTASIIYVGTWDGEMHKTTDGGANWSPAGSGLPVDNEITVISVDPNTPATVYAGTNNSGIYKSVDSGANWIASNGTIDFSWVEDIKIDPAGNIYVMAWTHEHGGGTYYSDDGVTWTKLLTADPGWSPGDSIAIDPSNADIIYVASQQNVIKTIDAGSNWTTYSVSSAQTEAIVINPLFPQILYAATGGEGVWKSINGGQTWTKASNGINALHFVGDSPHGLEIDRSNPNYIYAGSINGGYRSTNGGSSWEKMDHPSGSILALFTHPDVPGNVYSYHNAIEISDNYGASGSWQMPTGFPCCFSRGDFGIAADDPNLIYVGTWGSDDPQTGVWKSVNGVDFTLMNAGLSVTNTEVQTLAVHPGIEPGDNEIVFIGLRRDWPFVEGKDYGVYKTIDGGASWNKITCGLPDDFFARQILFTPSDPNTMFMLGETEHECGFYESTDGGNCWTKLSDYCGNSMDVDPIISDLVYMGAWDGFYVSLNGGADWTEFNDGLPRNPGIDAVALDPNDSHHVFIGTAAGVYEATISFDFEITTENLPLGVVGEPYIAIIDARGGSYPISWEIVSGDLPAGFTFNDTGTTSEIEGIASEPGYWDIAIKATDNSGNSYTKRYDLNISNKYFLTVNTNPEGVGSVSIDPNEPWYVHGSLVDVSVNVPGGHVFTGWSGDATGTATLVHVEMTRDKTLTANFALPADLPDYTIDSFTLPATADAGQVIGGTVSAMIENLGADDSYTEDILVGIYLSSDSVIATSDILLWHGRSSIAALNGGATTNVSISPALQIPTTVSAGLYYIGILVDESYMIAEREESNNHASQAITLSSTAYDGLEFLGQWHGGESNAVASDETRNLALVGHGALLQVLDVSDPSHPTKIGEIALGSRGISDIEISGNFAYVAGHGFWIVDITNPTHPAEVGYNESPNLARGIVISGDYAYVTDHFHQGLRVFNISDPNNPNQVSFTPFPGRTRGIAISGDTLYLSAGIWLDEGESGIRIVDITDPENPEQVNFYSAGGQGWPEVAGNVLFLPTSGTGLYIFDISDSHNPSLVTIYDGVQNSGWIKVDGNHAYITDNNRNAIAVLNVSDVNNVYEEGVHYFEDQTSINSMDVLGNYCLANGWYHSLKILDVSNPQSPNKIGSYDEYEGMFRDVDVSEDFAFVTTYNEKGVGRFRALDISTLPDVTDVGVFLNFNNMYRVRISGNFAFVATDDQEFKVLDISDPSHPHEVAVYGDFENIYDLEVSGNYAYVADYFQGLKIFDISTPSNPVLVSTWYTHPRSYRLAISGNYAYVSALWAGVRIIDISDPMNPWEVGFYQAEDLRAYEVEASGNYVYVEDANYNMRIIDVSDPQNPVEIATFVTEVIDISDIEVSGHVVFAGSYVKGMIVIDVSDPYNPVQLDEFPTFYTRAITVRENHIYELARGSGLIVYEYRRQ